MLQIVTPEVESFNNETNTFIIDFKPQTLQLEHSLVSLSKWESTWCKPFLVKGDKTQAESVDYVRCMTLTQNVDPRIYEHLSQENIDAVTRYIDAPMTATTFFTPNTGHGNEIITSEIIYYWMIALNIPFECQKWHLNRLLTLIKVCTLKNQPTKKLSQAEMIERNRALNEMRRKQLNSRG